MSSADNPAYRDRPPTPDEVQRVRRAECATNGHSWDVVETPREGPVLVTCRNCGETYKVMPHVA